MLSFLLALAGSAAAMLAGRQAVRVARLSGALGAGPTLLAASWLACVLGSGLAAWVGSRIGAQLGLASKAALAAIVLLLAAAELMLARPGRAPVEPTRSFGAILLVLGGAQLVSAAGLLVFALAVATAVPGPAAFGGTLGAGAVLTGAWRGGREWEARMPLRALRWSVAGLLLLAALAVGLFGRGLPG